MASGNSLYLQDANSVDPSGDYITVDRNGSFVFMEGLMDNATYDVTVVTQPSSPVQTCSVTSGIDAVNGTNVTDIKVDCVP